MKKISLFIAFICLFVLAAWPFGEDNNAAKVLDSTPVITEQEPADPVLFAKKKQSRKKSREQQINEWFHSLSLKEKELLYRLKPEIDTQRRIEEDQMRRKVMNGCREIAQR